MSALRRQLFGARRSRRRVEHTTPGARWAAGLGGLHIMLITLLNPRVVKRRPDGLFFVATASLRCSCCLGHRGRDLHVRRELNADFAKRSLWWLLRPAAASLPPPPRGRGDAEDHPLVTQGFVGAAKTACIRSRPPSPRPPSTASAGVWRPWRRPFCVVGGRLAAYNRRSDRCVPVV